MATNAAQLGDRPQSSAETGKRPSRTCLSSSGKAVSLLVNILRKKPGTTFGFSYVDTRSTEWIVLIDTELSLTMMSDIGTTKPAINGTSSTTPQASQPLTHYHSKLYSLLSWERPSATASSFATVVLFIVASRYLPLIRWTLKFLYLALGVTASAEVGGRLLFSRGLTSASRPRKYYTIPKDTVESFLEDLENLVDFFLIEFQRILFVENLTYTVSAFVTALISYWLVMFLPLWGLALIATCIAYLAPLVYITNKEFIDSQLGNAQEIVATQASHVKEMAETQTAQATGIVKQYVGDYRAKANGYIGSSSAPVPAITAPETAIEATPKAVPETVHESVPETAAIDASEPEVPKTETLDKLPDLQETPDLREVAHADFPEAPKDEPVGEVNDADKGPELIQIA
ncbi:cwl1 [Arthroderma uncinatum]|uniref:cwl1 n=1 Tax=Arthroderma uncinatum TaxID=74035 RepID=UPI00144AACA8|nr:cwl1 [Arthroderma uncinatum]KAF3482595.1 cwl1 [Arthroderma uncinatum]